MWEREFFIDSDKPLELGHGFYHTTRALGRRDVLLDVLFFLQKILATKPLHDYRARVRDFLTAYGLVSNGHASLLIYNLFNLKIVSLGNLPIGMAVRGGYAHRSRAECGVYFFICHDFDMERYAAKLEIVLFADKFFVARIIWVHRDSSVSDFGFGACGGNRYGKIFAVSKCIKLGRAFFIYYLIIGYGGLSFCVPIYNPITAINQAVIVHFFKHGAYRERAFLVQSVCLARPVARCTHGFNLRDDGVVTLFGEIFHPA